MTGAVHDKCGRKEQILKAALDLFLNKGFHATSMANIAQAAGISTSHLYNFFENKAEIALAVERHMVEGYYQALENASDSYETKREFDRNDFAMCFDEKRAGWVVTILTEALRNKRVMEELLKTGEDFRIKNLKKLNLDTCKKEDVLAYEYLCCFLLGLMIRNMFTQSFSREQLIELAARSSAKIMEVGAEAARDLPFKLERLIAPEGKEATA